MRGKVGDMVSVRTARAWISFACIVAAAVARPCAAGMLESTDETGSIAIELGPVPPVLADPAADFSMLGWVRRDTPLTTGTRSILSANGVLGVGYDDDDQTMRFEMRGSSVVAVTLPAPPVSEWTLWAASWDAGTRELTAWVRSESTDVVQGSAADPVWTGAVPWPMILGAADGAQGFAGQIGLTVVREHALIEGDVEAMWHDGAPHYFAPALHVGGSLDGFAGVTWMIGHVITTKADGLVNPNAVGAEVGDVVTPDNVVVWNDFAISTLLSAARIEQLTGAWQLRSPFETGEPWSGFFVRDPPDLGLTGGPTRDLVAPKSRRLARDEPAGLMRVIASANSRGTIFSRSYDRLDNWAYGGLFESRRSSVAGAIVPAMLPYTSWPFFLYAARLEGEVYDSRSTPYPSAAFGNFGSHGTDNPAFPGYAIVGRVTVIEPGGAYIPKARPEPGTLLSDTGQPVTVRAMLLRFPGAGEVRYEGAKASSQYLSGYTTVAPATTVALDTTTATHAMTAADVVILETLALENAPAGIEVGDGCFITTGPGAGGISVVTAVAANGATTTLTLERRFPVDPAPGSVLAFGPIEPIWIEHAWAGLAAEDPEIYRGIRLEAVGGIAAVLFVECSNPTADGFIIGGAGRSGRGYGLQLQQLFNETGVPFIEAIQPDVWLQFFAHQNSQPDSMIDYTEAIRRSAPDTEIWWCGDPDLDLATDDIEGTDAWQQFILDNAEGAAVGAIVAHEHPDIGSGFDRAADGQVGDMPHPTARGSHLYVDAVLDLMRDAALDVPCAGDIDGSGDIGFSDLTALLGTWGPCPAPCASDLDDDGQVGFSDLTLLLAQWGPCSPST